MESQINLLTKPTSLEGLEIVKDGYFLNRLKDNNLAPLI
jgi:hypothetical protein